ncbi:MAG: hypothetical protein H6Q71_2483 [Firmicutes bacterium]|nr:hypothetical protein [Bacillota bacterium]
MNNEFLSLLIYLPLGFCIGILSGCFGIGGAFILTPTLSALGIPITYAVGTGLAFTTGVSSLASYKHFFEKNISIRATLYIGLICLLGIRISQQLVILLENLHKADLFINATYIIMLLSVGILMYRKNTTNPSAVAPPLEGSKLDLRKMPPLVKIDKEQSVSIWMLIFIGLFVGFLQGFMGVGGGFILVPLLIWLLDMNPRLAIGTSLFTLLLTSIYATVLYFFSGKVLLPIAFILVFGSFLGVNLGIRIMKNSTEGQLTKQLSLFILLSTIGIALRMLSMVTFALVYTLSLIAFTTLWLIVTHRSKM